MSILSQEMHDELKVLPSVTTPSINTYYSEDVGFCPPYQIKQWAFNGLCPVGFCPVGLFPVGFCPVGLCPVGFCPLWDFVPVGFSPFPLKSPFFN